MELWSHSRSKIERRADTDARWRRRRRIFDVGRVLVLKQRPAVGFCRAMSFSAAAPTVSVASVVPVHRACQTPPAASQDAIALKRRCFETRVDDVASTMCLV